MAMTSIFKKRMTCLPLKMDKYGGSDEEPHSG